MSVRSVAGKAGVVLGGLVLALAAISLVQYVRADQEKLALDEAVRRSGPGSFVRLPAGVTHYELAGPRGADTVLLIPGFSVTYTVWDPTFDALVGAGFRVLRYDLFGRGYSDRPDAAYDAAFYDRQILDLLDALDIRNPVNVAGLSMGGPIATAFAVNHPERVRRVVLEAPAYSTGYPPPLELRAPLLGQYLMTVRVAPGLPESQWADFVHPERFPRYLDPYRKQMRYRGFRRALLATMRNYLSQDMTEYYRRLGHSGKPVLLIWGRADQDVPFETSGKVRQSVPQAEFLPVDDAAHIPAYEHPEVVNPVLIRFLQK